MLEARVFLHVCSGRLKKSPNRLPFRLARDGGTPVCVIRLPISICSCSHILIVTKWHVKFTSRDVPGAHACSTFNKRIKKKKKTRTHAHTQGNSYDCCHRFYGSPEYPLKAEPDDSSYRAVDKFLFADVDEILANTVIVDKDGVTVSTANSRFADDEIVIDNNCTGSGVPESSCVGFRQKMQHSDNVARCADNNQTVCTIFFLFFLQDCTVPSTID